MTVRLCIPSVFRFLDGGEVSYRLVRITKDIHG